LARRVLAGFEHLRKAFKKLSVPHTKSIQAQILNPESLTPSKSPMWTFPIGRRLTGHQRRFGIRMQSVFTRTPQMMRLKKMSLLRERIAKPFSVKPCGPPLVVKPDNPALVLKAMGRAVRLDRSR
jgi:hypothetical protein